MLIMKLTYALTILIILASFGTSLALYDSLPEKMASHWNSDGEVDDYMSKFWGAFLMPVVSLGMFLLFLFIPKIDPLKKNIQDFRKYYDYFILIMISFMFYIYLLTLFWNLGHTFNMTQMLLPAFAILFYYIGVLTQNAKQNWFIGIRNPWTLSSKEVWDKTHKLGGKLFKVSAILILFGLVLPDLAVCFMLIPILATAIITIIYSYIVFSRTTKK